MAIIQVRRANVILDVPEEQKGEYLAKGFDVIDAQGRVIERTTPNDINTLKKAYAELTEKVKALEEENKQLKEKLSDKPVKPEKVEKVEKAEVQPEEVEEVEAEPEAEEPEEIEKPRRRRKKQQ